MQRFCSFGARGNDFEVFVDSTVAVDTSLKSIKDLASLNEFSENGLVAIKIGCSAESDRELRASSVLSVVRESELATFVVSHGQILILQAQAECTNVFVAHAASRDSEATLSLVERRSGVGATLSTIAKSAEALSGGWLSL